MSRSDRLIARVEDALRGIKVETSDIYCHDARNSRFGLVNIVTFLWRLEENDSKADEIAKDVSRRLAEKNICAIFHKTRRQAGERLITAGQALSPEHSDYSFNALSEFTRSWLIQATHADEKQKQQQKQNENRLRFRM